MSAPEPTLADIRSAVERLTNTAENNFRLIDIKSGTADVRCDNRFTLLDMKLDQILAAIAKVRADIAAKEALYRHVADADAHHEHAA